VKLDAMGMPLSTPVFINGSSKTSILPSIVKDGDSYVVAWQEGSKDDSPPVTVQVRRLDREGNPVGNIRQIETTAIEARPVLTRAYDKLALTWIDDKGTAAAPAKQALIAYLRSEDFAFEAGSPVALVPPNAPPMNQNSFPAIAVTPDSLAVSWVADSSSVYTANVGDGLQISTPSLLYSSEFVAQQIDVIAAGDHLFTAWEDLSGDLDTGRERVRGAFSTSDGKLENTGIVHELDTGSANWPRLAWNGDSVAVVYYQ
jgi:hypothetical protein